VEIYVHFLRKKIDARRTVGERTERASYIETVRGVGYVLRV